MTTLPDPSAWTYGRAVDLARRAHQGQVRELPTGGGEPYIHHPIRVSMAVHHLGELAQIVAVMHDVIEDTAVTLRQLRDASFPSLGLVMLDALTRRLDEGETYTEFIERCRDFGRYQCLAVIEIKEADIRDNIETCRGTKWEGSIPRWEHGRILLRQ